MTWLPDFTFFTIPDWAFAITFSPTFKCPDTPTCPAKIVLLPILLLPAIPTCPQITTFSPIETLCAIWTKLSILDPLPITVFPNLALSTHELAPISTLSSIITTPSCGIFFLCHFVLRNIQNHLNQ